MNQREAILKAADHIERHSEGYDFWHNIVPVRCGSHGCALGWIGYFAGLTEYGSAQQIVSEYLGIDSSAFFYADMCELTNSSPNPYKGWYISHSLAAKGLRLYADKRYPLKTPNWEEISARRLVLPSEVSEEVQV